MSSAHPDLVGSSPVMHALRALVARIAVTDCTVLITGESGTGKEVVARIIHASSPRAGNLFVPVNCAAIPEALLESELFGYQRGAFTGAVSDNPGKFEAADGGTIFLDEIAEMPMAQQAKLLRVLQDHIVERLNGKRPVPVNIRVIAATNADLKGLMQHGQFREDLFHRLNVIPVVIPPLRERVDDIDVLVPYLLDRLAIRLGLQRRGITPESVEVLKRYAWPGNVRELENACERLLVLAGGGAAITPIDLRRCLTDLTFDEPAHGEERKPPAIPEVRMPRKPFDQLTVNELIRAVIVFRCSYGSLAAHLALHVKRPDQVVARKLHKLEVFKTIANRFRAAALRIPLISRSCGVTDGELLMALKSNKFCRAVNLHLDLYEYFRELHRVGESAAVVEFVKAVAGPYVSRVAASVDPMLVAFRGAHVEPETI